LGPYLRLGRGEFQSGGADRPSNLADALESILGALYLDGGMKAVRRLFMARFAPILDRLVVAPDLANPKGALQEHFQKTWKTEPQYRMKEERGPPHDRQYTAEVLRAQSVLGAGHGPSKQAAQVAAALEALRALGLLPEPMDATDPGPPGSCSAD
jgi:ribonuclease-3